MQLIAFSKHFQDKTPAQLVEIAHANGLDGWDLCVRPGHPVNPDNAAQALPEAARLFAAAGLSLPMVTGNFDLLEPEHATARPLLAAMNRAGVRELKLGYYAFDPAKQDYWREVDRIRRAWEGWQRLAGEYEVRVNYHTHSNRCMGMTGGMLAHLLRGFDPRRIGAYLDPAHLLVEGEEFAVALAIVREHLSLVALKDVLLAREEASGHGRRAVAWVKAGEGMVDWTAVFAELARARFDGPMSVHCEFLAGSDPQFLPAARRECAFFRAATGCHWPLRA
jgi:sugar phosphate isomerase/epimerase